MTVVNVEKDADNLTLTIEARFDDATVEQVWDVWEDPQKLERWWAPPTLSATFTRHDFFVGGESRYYMTDADGEKYFGYWQIQMLDKPKQLEFLNGMAGSDGEPIADMAPGRSSATFEEFEGSIKMSVATRFLDVAQMKMMLDMGMAEGLAGGIGKIDALLGEAVTA